MLALSCTRYQSLPLSGCFLHSTSEDNITLLKNSPIKIFVDHLQRRNFFWLNNFKLKISRGEFFQNYGIRIPTLPACAWFLEIQCILVWDAGVYVLPQGRELISSMIWALPLILIMGVALVPKFSTS